MLKSLPVRLKIPNLTALGIVLDADQSLERRWQSVLDRLNAFGYIDLPAEPDFEGTIITCEGMPKVGIWIMPNNQIPGMLEDFVAFLIPENDQLAAKASTVLEEIEQSGLNKYSLNHHSKAFLHTWLAWQENPGQPMGQAITAHTLNCNAPLANLFVAWLNKLFVEK